MSIFSICNLLFLSCLSLFKIISLYYIWKADVIINVIIRIKVLAPLRGPHTPLASASPAPPTVAPPASKCYQPICDPKASCWLHTLANLSNVVYEGKKLNAVVIANCCRRVVHGEKSHFGLVLVLLCNRLIFSAINSRRNVGAVGRIQNFWLVQI